MESAISKVVSLYPKLRKKIVTALQQQFFIDDFKTLGIESKIPYFKEIGVGTVWLSPIYESPMKDFGYDISNFTNIEPQFGTMEDFQSLSNSLKEAGTHIWK